MAVCKKSLNYSIFTRNAQGKTSGTINSPYRMILLRQMFWSNRLLPIACNTFFQRNGHMTML